VRASRAHTLTATLCSQAADLADPIPCADFVGRRL